MQKAATAAVAAVATIFAEIAASGPLEDANNAYRCRDYLTALELWRPLADQGSAEAQAKVGTLYDFGFGVPQSYASAASWFRKIDYRLS